jgi:hypothetical protein
LADCSTTTTADIIAELTGPFDGAKKVEDVNAISKCIEDNFTGDYGLVGFIRKPDTYTFNYTVNGNTFTLDVDAIKPTYMWIALQLMLAYANGAAAKPKTSVTGDDGINDTNLQLLLGPFKKITLAPA